MGAEAVMGSAQGFSCTYTHVVKSAFRHRNVKVKVCVRDRLQICLASSMGIVPTDGFARMLPNAAHRCGIVRSGAKQKYQGSFLGFLQQKQVSCTRIHGLCSSRPEPLELVC